MTLKKTNRSAKGRLGCLMALLLFSVVVGGVLWANWDLWFGDLPEDDFRLSDRPQRVYLLPGADGLTQRTITWISGDSVDFRLYIRDTKTEYPDTLCPGLKASFRPTIKRVETGGGTTFVYSVHLPEFPQKGTIWYDIRNSSGQRFIESSFVLPAKEARHENFVFIGDIQDREPSDTKAFIDEVATAVPDADAWLFVGDQIERPHDKFWDLFYHDVSTVAGKVPFIPATGNHEYQLGLNFDLDDRWPFIFDMPSNGPDTPEGVSYYVDYPFARIVVLDTNVYAWFFPGMNDWLRKVLSERKDHPFLIVMGHHPVFSVREGRNNHTVDLALSPLMEEMGVALYLSGHDHAYSRNVHGGVAHIVSASATKTYPVGDPSEHIVSRSGERYYVTLRASRDSLLIRSFVQGSHLPFDSLTITHKNQLKAR